MLPLYPFTLPLIEAETPQSIKNKNFVGKK
jgi:hypothetical protein